LSYAGISNWIDNPSAPPLDALSCDLRSAQAIVGTVPKHGVGFASRTSVLMSSSLARRLLSETSVLVELSVQLSRLFAPIKSVFIGIGSRSIQGFLLGRTSFHGKPLALHSWCTKHPPCESLACSCMSDSTQS